jgi:hypothetical protein
MRKLDTVRRRAARLYVQPDPHDPLLFLLTEKREGADSIPVIPTPKAHEYWVCESLFTEDDHDDGASPSVNPGIRPNHPSNWGPNRPPAGGH